MKASIFINHRGSYRYFEKRFLALVVEYFDCKDGSVCKLLALRECSAEADANAIYK